MPEDVLTLEFVKCRLLDEETKRKGTEMCTVKSEPAAFSGAKQAPKNRRIKCFRCKQEGHKLAECPAKKKEDAKKKFVNKSKAHVADQSEVCFAGFSRGSAGADESKNVPVNRASIS
ncbi:AAEL011418-PA [Aedes aegypti]|uniref:AAEL011418-PA n=1 Tax=Aedes aegypti TaxID=7159 RepID=Q0IEC4_AEDAE|nr:AAEL011418-PA [Aedes aegypti]